MKRRKKTDRKGVGGAPKGNKNAKKPNPKGRTIWGARFTNDRAQTIETWLAAQGLTKQAFIYQVVEDKIFRQPELPPEYVNDEYLTADVG